MRRQKAMGRSGGNRSTHQVSYTELKAESLRRFYAGFRHPGEHVLADSNGQVASPDAVHWDSVVLALKLIKRFREGTLRDLEETNYLRKAKAFLAGAK